MNILWQTNGSFELTRDIPSRDASEQAMLFRPSSRATTRLLGKQHKSKHGSSKRKQSNQDHQTKLRENREEDNSFALEYSESGTTTIHKYHVSLNAFRPHKHRRLSLPFSMPHDLDVKPVPPPETLNFTYSKVPPPQRKNQTSTKWSCNSWFPEKWTRPTTIRL